MLSHVSSSLQVATLGVDPTVVAWFSPQRVEPSDVIAAENERTIMVM